MKNELSEVQKLEEQLRKAKARENDTTWMKIVEQYDRIGKFLTNKVIIQFSAQYNWTITKITGYKREWNTSSGLYGQFDQRRYLCLTGQRLGLLSNHRYNTNVMFEEELKGITEVYAEWYKIGIPVKMHARGISSWNRFLEIGQLEHQEVIISLGKEAYEDRDIEAARTALRNFQMFCRLAPDGLWEKLVDHYWKQAKLANELYQEIGDETIVKATQINWEKI